MPVSNRGERLAHMHICCQWLRDHQETRKDQYQRKTKAETFPPGTKVAVRIRGATKGTAKWEPGFLVLSGYQGGLRLKRLEDGHVIHYHQSDCRALPDPIPYETVDPLPVSVPCTTDSADAILCMNGAAAIQPALFSLNPLAAEFVPCIHASGQAPSNLHGSQYAIEVAPRGWVNECETGETFSDIHASGYGTAHIDNDWSSWLYTVHAACSPLP